MTPTALFADAQEKIIAMLRASPAAELERNVRAVMSASFQKMDLVTREEFEIQRELLAHTQQRIIQLEQRIAVLEAKKN
jgi:ubiquinone biosynthesis accessory factor UbiK